MADTFPEIENYIFLLSPMHLLIPFSFGAIFSISFSWNTPFCGKNRQQLMYYVAGSNTQLLNDTCRWNDWNLSIIYEYCYF